MLRRIADGEADAAGFRRDWEAATYSFPRGALRLRWLEEKEQGRAFRFFGPALHRAAASVHLTLDGVPHIMMGQEFNEPRWHDWSSLFDGFALDHEHADGQTLEHYRALIALRRRHPALRRGTVEFVALDGPRQLGYWRRTPGEQLFVMVNLDRRPCVLPAEVQGLEMLYMSPGSGGELAPFGSLVARGR